jgi:hypothetical protein
MLEPAAVIAVMPVPLALMSQLKSVGKPRAALSIAEQVLNDLDTRA